jgi:hypothetical protein
MTTTTPKRRLLRALGWTLGALVAFTALMGFAHTRAGRPLLALLGKGCPLDKATPQDVEKLRQTALDKLRGATAAAARPALGLQLDVTSEGEAVQWAESKQLKCSLSRKGMHSLRCSEVPPAALGEAFAQRPVQEVTFVFGPAGKLVAVDTWRAQLSSAEASALFDGLTKGLSAQLGQPTTTVGDASATYLGGGALHTAVANYNFNDYVASVSATNLAEKGIAVREKYQSARKTL